MKSKFDNVALGLKLYNLRKDRGWTISYLSELLDCSTCSIHKWESGGYVPQARYIVDLCRIYDVSADWLLGVER